MPRPEQQPQRRCQAITCLIPAGKLAPANFCRSLGGEVARTSGSAGGARARARSPVRCLLPPRARRPRPRPLSRPRALPPPASLLRPPPRYTGRGCRETPTRAAWTCTVSWGSGAERTQSQAQLSASCQSRLPTRPGAVASVRTKATRTRAEARAPSEELRRHAEPPPRLKPECPEAPAKQEQAKETQAAKARAAQQRRSERRQRQRGPPKKWWWWASWPWRRLSPARSSGKRDKPASARNPMPASVSAAPAKAKPAATKTS